MPITLYRRVTNARNAGIDLEVGQRSFCFSLKENSLIFPFPFQLMKRSFNFYFRFQPLKDSYNFLLIHFFFSLHCVT